MSVRNTTNRLYNIWGCMKQRCNNPKHTAAAWYHDKGIRVCDEWNTNFKSFETWALCNGYADDLSIDRIDSDKNYCPENCRWIPIAENRRRAIQNCLNISSQQETKGVEIMSVSEKKKILDEIAALPPQLRSRALDILTGAKMGLEYAEKKEKTHGEDRRD